MYIGDGDGPPLAPVRDTRHCRRHSHPQGRRYRRCCRRHSNPQGRRYRRCCRRHSQPRGRRYRRCCPATDTPGADATAAAATPVANQVLTPASITDDRQGPTAATEQLQTPLLTIHPPTPPQQHFREVLQSAPRALTTSSRCLIKTTSFPLSTEATAAFDRIKSDIAAATLHAIDESVPFQVESDASDFALAATLNQAGRPVAFFSRTLQGPESRHSSIEKEAQAIVEAVRRWRHYLAGRRFTLLTDQRAVSFMFSNTQRGKIKNDKIARWRIELSTFNYDILYRPGKLNDPPDALSRGTCASIQMDRLRKLHEALCHPGVTRFAHFVKARNLPYTVEEIRSMTRACAVCAECKPHFFRPDNSHVIKATRPFERLSVDFKGPLPSTNLNTYILTAIDEYSRRLKPD
ncbi:uncharacterized protein [Narcine bancroftii]|uniref:uncharacterized protein n=1 Tax=Narcine bancroftii TaxID=1343680 RepID=UPI003831CE35